MTGREGASPKIVPLERLLEVRSRMRAAGEVLVQCHGCFDLVHPGHVRHLQHAATHGDRLLVTITADPHVAKGDGRPLFSQDLRAESLAALNCVDWVCINPDDTAEALLERIRPDIYVKGREYESNDDPRFAAERATVERHGGRVVFSSGDIVFSSSALIGALGTRTALGGESMFDPVQNRLRQLRTVNDLGAGALSKVIDRMSGRRVLVVGEAIIDSYVQCAWPQVARESPVLSLRPLERRTFDGGAAIVARHLVALGAKPVLLTALPRDLSGAAMRERLSREGVDVHPVVTSAPIPEKERYLVGREKLVKLDRVQPIDLDSRARGELLGLAGDLVSQCEACIITDFGLGMLTPRVIAELCGVVRARVDVLAGDVSGLAAGLTSMRDADWLSPAEPELRLALGDHDSSLPAVTWELLRRTRSSHAVVTLGAEGAIMFRRTSASDVDGSPSRVTGEHIPSLAPNPIDTLGCGDALLATGVLSLLSGADPVVAAYLGSVGAALEAACIGNEPIDANALRTAVLRLDEAAPVVRRLRLGEEASPLAG